VFGVGTSLITSSGDSSLSGVYKIAAVRDNGEWKPTLKLSETVKKMTLPGQKQVWRIIENTGKATADLICSKSEEPELMDTLSLINIDNDNERREVNRENVSRLDPMLIDIIKDGKLVYDFPLINELRELRKKDLNELDFGVRRLVSPHIYQVSISSEIWQLKKSLLKIMNSR
jgi:nicotinate phosphoribosyltransferase